MRHIHHGTGTDARDQRRSLLDRLVGDPSAVDEYYTARQQSGSVDRNAHDGHAVWAWS